VRPLLSGICGSDLATITAKGSVYFSPFTSCPFVLGHEVVGEVVEASGQTSAPKEGDRVVLEPPLTCEIRGITRKCEPCQAGNKSLCVNFNGGDISPGIQTGYCRDTGGGWSDSFVAHYKQLHPVPDQLSNEQAVIAEPLSCALQAVQKAPWTDDCTVLILGCGSMGALTLAAIRGLRIACRVVVVAKYSHQREAAVRLGADVVVQAEDPYPKLAEILHARLYKPEFGRPTAVGGADICFDCVGSGRTIDDALRFTRGGGSVILVGMPGVPRNIDWTAIWHKELVVKGSYTSEPATFQRALELLVAQRDSLGGIVGAKFPLKEYRAALQCALNTGRSKTIKTVFQFKT
jgi:threonine dehydrogenase-like Zn-dependent dehydrogenase